MRALGDTYDAALASRIARPCYRVQLANHGGGFAEPLDVTDHVAQLEITRPLRSGNAATILLHSEDGRFDPISGVRAAAVRAANAEVRIDLGEILGGVPTYWRVMTGQVARCLPRYGTPVQTVELEVLDRASNPWQYIVTSPNYAYMGVTPVGWTAHQAIMDLFARFLGFGAGEFALDPLSDWVLTNSAQLQQMSLCAAANALVQPVGYRAYFNYYGQLASALLVPAGWGPVGTVDARNIADEGIEGPTDEAPDANRVRVVGGASDCDMAAIGDETIFATASAAVRIVPTGSAFRGYGGDAYAGGYFGVPNTYRVYVAGPNEEAYRVGASAIVDVRYRSGTAADFTPPAGAFPWVESETYNTATQRQEVVVRFTVVAGPTHDLEIEFDIGGHRAGLGRPQVYTQAWDDALITRWGERDRDVQAPCVWQWNAGALVAEQELAIGVLSDNRAEVPLDRLDLRPEPGDVLTIENPRQANFDAWLYGVQYSCSRGGCRTLLQGYVI